MSQSIKRSRQSLDAGNDDDHENDDEEDMNEIDSALTRTTKPDAFAILLASSQKESSPSSPNRRRRRSTSSSKKLTKDNASVNAKRKSMTRFVPCPAGCGQHVAMHNIDRHLDKCFQQQQKRREQVVPQVQDDTTNISFKLPNHNTNLHPVMPTDHQKATEMQSKNDESVSPMKRVMAGPPTTTSEEEAALSSHTVNMADMSLSNTSITDNCNQDELLFSTNLSTESPNNEVEVDTEQVEFVAAATQDEQQCVAVPNNNTQATTMEILCGDNSPTTQQSAVSMGEMDSKQNKQEEDSTQTENAESCEVTPKKMKPIEDSMESVERKTNHSKKRVRQSTSDSSETETNQLFLHMMARSKQVFQSKRKEESTECWFWLTAHGVSIRSTGFDPSVPTWTSTIKLRNGPTVHLATNLPPPAPPQQQQHRRRYSKHHSRLSVPVLKSILQKSVRRRKPLPSVRVAFELADKSLGDLLRRLPILILEDSTLHPDIGLVVWLMMAHSKDFEPSPVLMERVFRVVFEIASCQWQDSLDWEYLTKEEYEESSVQYAKIINEIETTRQMDPKQHGHRLLVLTCVWSMLARASYGGMHGDVKMLHGFATLWYNRCTQAESLTSSQVASPSLVENKCSWCQVPVSIHQKSREQSLCTQGPFMNLFHCGIDYLLFKDITVEGVDFHCSAVLDHLARDDNLVQLSTDLMILSDEVGFPQSRDERLVWLSRVWKSCLWDYGSGVNFRRPLIACPNLNESKAKKNASHN
jgi:hypothetical protein